MSQFKIAVIIGSLRRDSFNRKLATALAQLAPPEFTIQLVEIGDLPLYNQDDDGAQAPAVHRLKAEIKSANGLIFVTPEYNRSIPGVLKNAIDHASRPYGQSAWVGKPAGVLGVSPSAAGTAMAQQHLRNILANLDVPTLGQPEVFLQMKDGLFESDGSIGTGSRQFLQGWMSRYVAWSTTLENPSTPGLVGREHDCLKLSPLARSVRRDGTFVWVTCLSIDQRADGDRCTRLRKSES